MTNTRETTIDKLIKNQTDSTHIQFFRYIFVGGAAFIVDIGSLIVLTQLFGIYYSLIFAAIAFILGLIANYALSIKWVFNKHTLDNMWSEFIIFAVIGGIGLGLNEFFIWLFPKYVSLFVSNEYISLYISKIIAAALILFWNFFARKLTLFR